MRQLLLSASLAAACAACDASSLLRPEERPRITSVSVTANEHNVLSAILDVRAEHADSVVVHYWPADATAPIVRTTPAIAVANTRASIPVLGLRAETRYLMR